MWQSHIRKTRVLDQRITQLDLLSSYYNRPIKDIHHEFTRLMTHTSSKFKGIISIYTSISRIKKIKQHAKVLSTTFLEHSVYNIYLFGNYKSFLTTLQQNLLFYQWSGVSLAKVKPLLIKSHRWQFSSHIFRPIYIFTPFWLISCSIFPSSYYDLFSIAILSFPSSYLQSLLLYKNVLTFISTG